MADTDLVELARRVEVQASNVSGNRRGALQAIADELYTKAGGRPDTSQAGDPESTPTRGPGVQSAPEAPAEPQTGEQTPAPVNPAAGGNVARPRPGGDPQNA